MLPVDQPDGLVLLTRAFFDFDSIAQQAIDRFVGIVEVLSFTERRRLVEFAQGFVDEDVVNALLFQPLAQQSGFDVAVGVPVFPVAQVGIAQLLEQRDDAILGDPLNLSNGAHSVYSLFRVPTAAIAVSGLLPQL